MTNYRKIDTHLEIYQLLLDFKDCFPHLKERIQNLIDYSKKLESNAEVYVATIEEKIVGMCCFYANDKKNFIGYITLIAVKSYYRKIGIGRLMIEFVQSIMVNKGMKYVKLEVDKNNYNAYNFYIQNGFEIDQEKEYVFYLLKKLESHVKGGGKLDN